MGAILTLESLQQETHAFDGFITVEKSSLPEYYKNIFPKRCKCGGEVIMTSPESDTGYTQLQCCNPDCWIKLAHRFAYFCKTLGFKGFGARTALSLFEPLHPYFRYPTFLSIFDTEDSVISAYVGDAYCTDFADLKAQLKAKAWPFKLAVAALGIPDLGPNSRLFDILKDPVTLLSFVLDEKTDELCEMAGIYSEQSRYYMRIYRLDIVQLFTEVMPQIISTPKNEVYVAITGSVSVNGKPLTRQQFIWMCEDIKDEKGLPAFKIVETVSASKVQFVIADVPSSTAKYSLGSRLGILITAQEFYNQLLNAAKGEDKNGV